MRAFRILATTALAIVLVGAAFPQSTAAARPGATPVLFIDGDGAFSTGADGAVDMSGPGEVWFPRDRAGRPIALEVRLTPADGSLPPPGSCEPATASFDVRGDRRTSLSLAGEGSVCGRWTDQTSVVTHVFTGRYVISDAGRKKLIGDDGFFEVGLTLDGQAYAYAVDT